MLLIEKENVKVVNDVQMMLHLLICVVISWVSAFSGIAFNFNNLYTFVYFIFILSLFKNFSLALLNHLGLPVINYQKIPVGIFNEIALGILTQIEYVLLWEKWTF